MTLTYSCAEAPVYSRAEATAQVERMLSRLCASEQEPQMRRVAVLYLFGSYLRDCERVGDVDIAVSLDLGEHYHAADGRLRRFPADTPGLDRIFDYHAIASGSWQEQPDQVAATIEALRGGERALSLLPQTEQGLKEMFPDVQVRLLWQRGESFSTARHRLDG